MTAPADAPKKATPFDTLTTAALRVLNSVDPDSEIPEQLRNALLDLVSALKEIGVNPATGHRIWDDLEDEYEKQRAQAKFVTETMGPDLLHFKLQVLLALIVRQPDKRITINAKEVDRTGDWTASMAVNHDTKDFIFHAKKKH